MITVVVILSCLLFLFFVAFLRVVFACRDLEQSLNNYKDTNNDLIKEEGKLRSKIWALEKYKVSCDKMVDELYAKKSIIEWENE
jgi:hypothetical protein